MRNVPGILCLLTLLLPLTVNAVPIKCAVLNKNDCTAELDCVWYDQAGCRTSCNFVSSNGCDMFTATGCVWKNNECIETDSIINATNFPSNGPSKAPTEVEALPTEAPSSKPTRNPTENPSNAPSLSPSLSPTYSPILVENPHGLVMYLMESKPFSDEKLKSTIVSVMQPFSEVDNPEFIPRVTIVDCPLTFKPLDTQIMDHLCKRFLPYINRNVYFSASSSTERIVAIRIHDKLNVPLIDVALVQRDLKERLRMEETSLLDFHFFAGNKEAKKVVPNVIMIMADDLGWGDVGYQSCTHESMEKDSMEKLCSPPNITKNIDLMAASEHSAVFNRFYTAPQCGPSRASFITGRQPIRECMLFNVFRSVPEGEIPQMSPLNCVHTVAELVRSTYENVETFHAGKWHLGKMKSSYSNEPSYTVARPLENGFQKWIGTERHGPTVSFNCGCQKIDKLDCNMGVYNSSYFWTTLEESDGKSRKFNDQNDPTRFTCEEYYGNLDGMKHLEEDLFYVDEAIEGDDSVYIVDKFETFLEARSDSQRPFFAQLWFHSPHVPVISAEPYLSRAKKLVEDFEPDVTNYYCGKLFNERFRSVSPQNTCEQIMKSFPNDYCSNLCKELKAHYYGSILALDEQVGRIRGMLAKKGLKEDTILIFTSDNGPARYDASSKKRYLSPGSVSNLEYWKFSPLEGGTRVPFILEYPRAIEENTIVSAPVSSYDYLPTILELLELDYDDKKVLDGVSLLPFIRDPSLERRKPIALVTVRMEKHFILQTSSLATLENQDQYRRYEFDSDLNRMVKKEKEGDKILKQDKYEELISSYEEWKAQVFDVSPCNQAATFLTREDFCDRRITE